MPILEDFCPELAFLCKDGLIGVSRSAIGAPASLASEKGFCRLLPGWGVSNKLRPVGSCGLSEPSAAGSSMPPCPSRGRSSSAGVDGALAVLGLLSSRGSSCLHGQAAHGRVQGEQCSRKASRYTTLLLILLACHLCNYQL